jgi:hypothetical protein
VGGAAADAVMEDAADLINRNKSEIYDFFATIGVADNDALFAEVLAGGTSL